MKRRDKTEAIRAVVLKMGLATFLTNLTVAIGFLTFLAKRRRVFAIGARRLVVERHTLDSCIEGLEVASNPAKDFRRRGRIEFQRQPHGGVPVTLFVIAKLT